MNEIPSLASDTDPIVFQHVRVKRRKRPSIPWLVLIPFFCIVAGWALYVFAMPILEDRIKAQSQSRMVRTSVELSSPTRELFRTCQFLAVCWFFYFGASIGSFFNVLAARLPAGRGVVFGGSKCPYCNSNLSKFANTPIFGWLWCRGKCLTCRLPISVKYLWIELIFGLLFTVLAARELFSGGVNLPNWKGYSYVGIIYTVFYPKWELIGAYLHHAFYLASLLMLAISCWERNPFPWRAWMTIVFSIVLIRFVRIDLEFVRWFEGMPGLTKFPFGLPSSGITILLGAVAGSALGFFSQYFLPSSTRSVVQVEADMVEAEMPAHPNQRVANTQWVQGCLLVGCVIGWQSVVMVIPVAFYVAWLWKWFFGTKSPHASVASLASLFLVAFLHLMAWRQIVSMIGIAS